jgi:hypothetical protein
MGRRWLHEDDLIGRDQVQGRPDLFVEQIGINVIRLQVGDPQIECLALPSNRFEISIFSAYLSRQAQPPDQPVFPFDQIVKKISGQGDADNRPENKMRPPLYFAQYVHWRERTIGDSESQQARR